MARQARGDGTPTRLPPTGDGAQGDRIDPPAPAESPAAKRVLLATAGSLGDLHPFLAVALALQARGHAAVVASHPAYRERVERLGLGFAPVRPDLPDPAAMARVMDPRRGGDEVFRRGVLPRLREAYDDTLAAVTAHGADLLVSHTLTMAVRLVAETTGIPWASAVLQPHVFFSAHDFPVVAPVPTLARLRRLGPRANRAVFAGLRLGLNRWVRPWHSLRSDLGLPPSRDNPILEGQHAPALVLALFSRHFAPPQPDWPPQTVQTGFPFLDHAGDAPLPPALAAFLDAGPPPLVFTLGSAAVLAAGDFYAASAAAAATLGHRAVLVVGDDPRNLAGLAPLPPEIVAVPYAPYAALFPRAAAIIHQGGIGTTAQALRAGRPMLVVPYGHDQPDNADRAVRLGVGRVLPRRAYAPAPVAAEIDRLLADPASAGRAAAIGERIGTEVGAAAAADALEKLFGGERMSSVSKPDMRQDHKQIVPASG